MSRHFTSFFLLITGLWSGRGVCAVSGRVPVHTLQVVSDQKIVMDATLGQTREATKMEAELVVPDYVGTSQFIAAQVGMPVCMQYVSINVRVCLCPRFRRIVLQFTDKVMTVLWNCSTLNI